MSEIETQHFLWSVAGGVGQITLNRPEKKNPLTFDSYAELTATFRKLTTEETVHAVVITGAGENFCSGGDVHEIIGPLTKMDSAGLLQFTRLTGELIAAIRACPQPVLSAIDGVCAGAGAAIAMASDLRYATPRARTAFLFTRVGLSGADMGACAMLPRIIGQGRAAELLFTGRAMTSEEGHAWGFYNALFEPADLLQQTRTIARSLADGPRLAHAVTKHQLNAEWNMPLEAAIEAEALAQARLMETEDFRRAYAAFVARQRPVFKGD